MRRDSDDGYLMKNRKWINWMNLSIIHNIWLMCFWLFPYKTEIDNFQCDWRIIILLSEVKHELCFSCGLCYYDDKSKVIILFKKETRSTLR